MSYRYATPVPVLQTIIDSRHFAELSAEEQLNPRGEDRADLRAGIVASTVANVNRSSGQAAYTPADFMPDFGGKKKKNQQTPQQMEYILKAAMLAQCSGVNEN